MTGLEIASQVQPRPSHLMPKTVLILGGTGDARQIADHLVEQHGDNLRVITSLAGRTSSPRQPKGEIREGGFGGTAGLADYLREASIDLLVDATHPYAAQISKHAAEAASTVGIPHILFSRPKWESKPEDNWLHISSMPAAADALPKHAKIALITTGIQNLDAFTNVTGPKLLVRLLEPPKSPVPIDDTEVIIGRPPYTLDGELALFKLLGIDTLVTKNAGGDATRAKIDAARMLGLQVIMIDRPSLPTAITVDSIEETMAWISQKLGLTSD